MRSVPRRLEVVLRWPAAAAVAVVLTVVFGSDQPDGDRFAQAGARLLAGHFDVYADSWLQGGPLQLVLDRLLFLGGSSQHPPVETRISVTLLVVITVWWAARNAPRGAQNVAAGLVAVWFAANGFWFGHTSEVTIALAWTWAGVSAHRGRAVRAGVLLAMATAVAPWGVLAAPVLLLGRRTVALRAVTVALVLAVATYAPFALSGQFALFQHVWPVDVESLVHVIDPSARVVTWFGRVSQAALVVTGCAAVAWRMRGRPEAAAFAALTAATLRVATDPLGYDYYWVPVGFLAVLVVATARPQTRTELVLLAAVGYLPWCLIALTAACPQLHPWRMLGYTGLLAAVVWRQPRKIVAPMAMTA